MKFTFDDTTQDWSIEQLTETINWAGGVGSLGTMYDVAVQYKVLSYAGLDELSETTSYVLTIKNPCVDL